MDKEALRWVAPFLFHRVLFAPGRSALQLEVLTAEISCFPFQGVNDLPGPWHSASQIQRSIALVHLVVARTRT
jgi:hypothetical protein